jgi:hypothetical protein
VLAFEGGHPHLLSTMLELLLFYHQALLFDRQKGQRLSMNLMVILSGIEQILMALLRASTRGRNRQSWNLNIFK